jgi:hypothetical protein
MNIPKSKRLRFSAIVIAANFIIGCLGIIYESDLTALGTFLALANTPLYAYILGDTFRASNLNDINK